MVGHEARGGADPGAAFVDMLEGVQDIPAIRVGLENRLLFVPTRGNVIGSNGVFNAEVTRQGK